MQNVAPWGERYFTFAKFSSILPRRKAKKILKWKLNYSGINGFRKGLSETINWQLNNRDLILNKPIINHPDIRRNLLDQKSFIEGGRALSIWVASLLDKSNHLMDENAYGLASLLTPVIKGYLSDKGFEMTVISQQILGGHGYIEEWGMSQFVRDSRIAMIYEGTNGVQAIDLVGRKLNSNGGQSIMYLNELVQNFIKENFRT